VPPIQTPNIYSTSGGEGETTYLLLHGLGATGDVWHGVRDIIEEKKLGRWIIPDMRGHGRSDWSESYGLGEHSNDIANLIRDRKKVIIIGHSMGGVIGLSMATSWFGLDIAGVVVIGTIMNWRDKDTEMMNAIAAKPSRYFETRDDAIERYLKVSGLYGLVAPDDPMVASGIKLDGDQEHKKFRLAADNATGTIGGPWMSMVLGIVECPYVLAAGENDPIVSAEDYKAFDQDAIAIPGCAHNAHVENPTAVWDLVEKLAAKL
jgi:pimeloyl-ACP methyl ester carboxylesterase